MNEIPPREPAGFSLKARLASFRYALKGIVFMLASQHNARVHLALTFFVVLAAMALRIHSEDWRWIVAATALVWFAEAMNTAFEYLCDVVSPDFHPAVERAKDIAAGAVLLCAAGASIIGLLTFWPYLRG
jgi:diacylglycerol kinase (ATP)